MEETLLNLIDIPNFLELLSCRNVFHSSLCQSKVVRAWINLGFPLCNSIQWSVQKVAKRILLFASSWLCEHGFSALTDIKSETRILPGTDDEISVRLAMLGNRFNLICSHRQTQPKCAASLKMLRAS